MQVLLSLSRQTSAPAALPSLPLGHPEALNYRKTQHFVRFLPVTHAYLHISLDISELLKIFWISKTLEPKQRSEDIIQWLWQDCSKTPSALCIAATYPMNASCCGCWEPNPHLRNPHWDSKWDHRTHEPPGATTETLCGHKQSLAQWDSYCRMRNPKDPCYNLPQPPTTMWVEQATVRNHD